MTFFDDDVVDTRDKFTRDREKAVRNRLVLRDDLIKRVNRFIAGTGEIFSVSFATGSTAEVNNLSGSNLGKHNTDDTRNHMGGAGYGLRFSLFERKSGELRGSRLFEARIINKKPVRSDFFLKLTKEDREKGFPFSHQDSCFILARYFGDSLIRIGILPIKEIKDWEILTSKRNTNKANPVFLPEHEIHWFTLPDMERELSHMIRFLVLGSLWQDKP